MTITKNNPIFQTSFALINDEQRAWGNLVMQPTLYDLIALGRVLKQLHWNVIGINFWPIHLHLDEIYGIVEEAIDEVAERLVATGHSPSGRLCDVTKNSDIEDAMALNPAHDGNCYNDIPEIILNYESLVKKILK
jgi:DNA-binding ferritin-like protein